MPIASTPPAGLSVEVEPDAVVITQRSLEPRRRLAALAIALVVAIVAAAWTLGLWLFGAGIVFAPLGLLLLVALVAGYALVGVLANSTRVQISARTVSVDYRPLELFADTVVFPEDVLGLHVARAQKRQFPFGEYELRAVLKHRPIWIVARGFETTEQARFVQQCVERRAGISPASAEPPPGTPEPEEATQRSLGTTLILLAATFALAAVASVVVVAATAKRGELVATIDLLGPDQTLAFDAREGERLRFHADVEIDSQSHPDMTRSGLLRMLEESKLTVVLREPGGAERASTCTLYSGAAQSTFGGLSSASVTGAKTTCSFTITVVGRHNAAASVVWPRGKPRRATLEAHKARD